MIRHKLRIRFRKEGELRLISHRDLLRAMERLFRRAELPLGMSQGFRPKARMQFPSALAVGVAGVNEVLDLELSEIWPAERVQAALSSTAPPGLVFTSVVILPANVKKPQVKRLVFEMPVPTERVPAIRAAIERFLTAAEFPIQREDKHRSFDLRPLVDQLELAERPEAFVGNALGGVPGTTTGDAFADARNATEGVPYSSETPLHPTINVLRMGLVMTPKGSARPREVLAAVGADDLEALGACIVRTAVELDEDNSIPSHTRDASAMEAGSVSSFATVPDVDGVDAETGGPNDLESSNEA